MQLNLGTLLFHLQRTVKSYNAREMLGKTQARIIGKTEIAGKSNLFDESEDDCDIPLYKVLITESNSDIKNTELLIKEQIADEFLGLLNEHLEIEAPHLKTIIEGHRDYLDVFIIENANLFDRIQWQHGSCQAGSHGSAG